MFSLGLGAQYRKLWLMSATRSLGDGVDLVAAPLLTVTLTKDPILVSGLIFAYRAPWLLFPLLGGVLVDRIDRRWTLSVTSVLRAALVAVLSITVATNVASLSLLYVVFFLMGTCGTLHDNAAQTIPPALVRSKDLERANGQLVAAEFMCNDFAGRPLGGLLFSISAALPFLFGAAVYATSAGLALVLRGNFGGGRASGTPKKAVLVEIGEGIRWLGGHRLLRTLAIVLAVMNITYSSMESVLVLFAQQVLHLGNIEYGLLFTCTAVGGLIGSRISESIAGFIGVGRTLLWCVVAEGATVGLIAMFPYPLFVAAMFVVIGLEAATWTVLTSSLRQAIVPNELLGRVGGIYRLFSAGGVAVGALMGGLLAHKFGLSAPFLAAALVLTTVAAVTHPTFDNELVASVRASGLIATR